MKMKAPGAVLLLLWSGVVVVVVAAESGDTATASTQQSCQPDIHTVLREMSALVVEQRVELRYTKTQVEAMETRLRASEKTVEEQRAVIKELKEKQEEQAAAVRAVGGRVNLTGSQVEELRREREERRVAFSASLVASGDETFGPFKDATPLVFKNPFINIGSAYNPNTVIAYSQQAGMYVKPSNGASLLLEVGDVVYLKLWPNGWARDNGNFHTTFSGHLLFPM
ncbi:uncharacterized protein LOC125311890 [Alosa alosa]|uniref:uncharacterized protein LOC125311890 n=1 Tax=Alosa alosa TaxID=278164 RepID=UPI00201505C4|nr:uncharacterized protein LOC125311890 [Alosa alosa]